MLYRLCKGGELHDEIHQREKFSDLEAATVMKEVLSCVTYLHGKHIIHR